MTTTTAFPSNLQLPVLTPVTPCKLGVRTALSRHKADAAEVLQALALGPKRAAGGLRSCAVGVPEGQFAAFASSAQSSKSGQNGPMRRG